jgi:hypothetical protein
MFDNELNALERDITGHCEGDCRDRVREGEDERQHAINQSQIDTPEYYPSVSWAKSRREQPGIYGGHV